MNPFALIPLNTKESISGAFSFLSFFLLGRCSFFGGRGADIFYIIIIHIHVFCLVLVLDLPRPRPRRRPSMLFLGRAS